MGAAALYAAGSVLAGYAAALLVLVEALAAPGRWRLAALTGVAGSLVSMLLSLAALLSLHGGVDYAGYTLSSVLGLGMGLRVDQLSAAVGLLVSVLVFLIAVYSVEYIGEWGAHRYWVFYEFFAASMLLLVYADDLVALIAGWEGTGLASWALIGFYHDDRPDAWVGDPGRRRLGVPMWSTPTHSALRAISFTRLADSFMLVAVGLLYSVGGPDAVRVSGLSSGAAGVAGVGLGAAGIAGVWLAMFYMGALGKSAQFPFHEWLVTAMTGPTSVSALIHAATMVKAGVYYAVRLTPLVAPVAAALGVLGVYRGLAWVALLTAFATATMALVARELKLVLAYSTASQLGYMLAAVFAAAAAGEPAAGSAAGLAHMVSHAVFKATLFLAAGAVIHAVHSRFMDDMGGLRRYMPYTFVAFLLAALSLAAIPPWSGWWSKDETVAAISMLGPLARGAALATAVLTAFYSLRMVYLVFLDGERFHVRPHEPGWAMLGPYLALGLASLGLGLAWPWLGAALAHAAGAAHPPESGSVTVLGTAAALSGAALALGLYASRLLPVRPERLPLPLRGVHAFLYDRWLLHSLIYRLVVYPGAGLSRLLARLEALLDGLFHSVVPGAGLRLVEAAGALERGYDGLFHAELPRLAAESSEEVRRLQTGDVRDYMTYFTAGIVFAAVVSALVIAFMIGSM